MSVILSDEIVDRALFSRVKLQDRSSLRCCGMFFCFVHAHVGQRRYRSAVFVLSFPLQSPPDIPFRSVMAEFDVKRFHERLEKLHSSLAKHR